MATVNAMTVDVEDYFQVSAFEDHICREAWETMPCRVERNTERILDLYAAHGIRATFFVLGWVGERFPRLVRRIVQEGHELASHGYSHVRVTRQTRRQFQEDVTYTRKLLEDIGGSQVLGYRAASYSIGAGNLWALNVLDEAGYRYSSSIYPIRHDHYGMPEAPRFPFRHGGQAILEIPISTLSISNYRIPIGGGGYFRLYPYSVSRWAIQRVNRDEKQPCIFYLHPWEIDSEQPRQPGLPLRTRVRHYLNLHRMEQRLEQLMRDFRWDRVDRVFLGNQYGGQA